MQLIKDLLTNRAKNEHVAPAISKLKSCMKDFEKVFTIKQSDTTDNQFEETFWNGKNFVVINLNDLNTTFKKLVPLILSYKLYNEHKVERLQTDKKSLNIIIDEAHNILSYSSMREAESWKDYRLETFEEIIKEGRKFGVFLTIASQRPSDISKTIISQLHNYFIHRLINEQDIEMVRNAVSYLDKVSLETLPILPVGACVLSGLMTDLPILIQVDKLEDDYTPKSQTIDLEANWNDD